MPLSSKTKAHRGQDGIEADRVDVAVDEELDIGGDILAGPRCPFSEPPFLLGFEMDRDGHHRNSEKMLGAIGTQHIMPRRLRETTPSPAAEAPRRR